jgi:predicted DNA-binding transcriptional regulator AlpA
MPELLTTAETAEYLRIETNSLEQMRCKLKGPPFVRLGRKILRYRRSDLENWVNSRVVMTEK